MDAITAEKRIQPVRRVSLQVSINGHDASSAIDPALLDFKFADNASGKADEIRLSLHDRDGKWHGDWRPALGMDVTATLVARDWEQEGVDLSLPCGTFRIDELEFSGPPDKVDIKAVSSALTTGLRDEKKTQAWESFSLRKLAGDVAGIVIGLTGFGKLDGSYFVEKAEHAVSSSGYRTSAEIRRTLSY